MSATLRTVPLVFLALVTGGLASAQPPQGGAPPSIKIDIVEMDPPSPATLHNGNHVYVRIRYDSRVPFRIHVQPSAGGSAARRARMPGEPLIQPGQGEVVAWFALPGAGSVDSVRASASIDSGRGALASQDVAVGYTWDGQASSTAETRAAWVDPLLAEADRRQQAAFQQMETSAQGAGSGGIGVVLVGVFGMVALGSLVVCMGWPIWGVVRWRGNWRIAAAVPLAAMALWGLKDAIDLARDPTSHNLLPFEFIEAAVISAPYMLVVTIWRASALKKQK
jgi:hypothetical protein